jgi:hypothetical protein
VGEEEGRRRGRVGGPGALYGIGRGGGRSRGKRRERRRWRRRRGRRRRGRRRRRRRKWEDREGVFSMGAREAVKGKRRAGKTRKHPLLAGLRGR